MKPFALGERYAPYIIAEIGVNHGGSFELAKTLIDQAAAGGAHAAKFQSYKAEKIASRNSPAYWDRSKEPTASQFELFKKYDAFGEDEYRQLAAHCAERSIDFLSTPFDLEAVDFLAPLMASFKVASADITNIPLLRKVAATAKPIILSTGASSLAEVELAVSTLQSAGAVSLCLLHCVLNYPTPPAHAQLAQIKVLDRVFPGCEVGYSDHVTPGTDMPALEIATLLGAVVLEKHFTHDKSLPGNDHYHAMDQGDLRRLVARIQGHRELLGSEHRSLENEAAARQHARRSIVAACDIAQGETLTEQNLIAKRPGHGISPIYWDEVVGRRLKSSIAEDTLLSWDLLEEQ